MKKYTVGIDVGGTNVKFGLVNPAGKIISRSRLSTQGFKKRADLLNALAGAVEDLIQSNQLNRSKIQGIGIGLPGLIDPVNGIVKELPNIAGWKNVPLVKLFKKKLNLTTKIGNDVNLITLAEWKYGAGKGCRHMICMTLGTGVGAGLILDNHLYLGGGFMAGELGHMPLNEKGPLCNCGGFACFERYVGNKQLLHKASKIFKRKDITLPEIKSMAKKGNKKALKFWDDAGAQIGNGLIGAVNLLNPQMIIVGGGVSNDFFLMSKAVKRVIQARAMSVPGKMVKIVQAKLGDDAGIIGARVLLDQK